MIRTLVEIRNGRVSIQETDSGTTVTVALDGAMSDPGALGAADAVETELQDQVARLEAGRKADHEEIVALRMKAEMFKSQAYSENERANQNREWAKRAEARVNKGAETIKELRELLAQRDKAVDQAADDLAVSQKLVSELRLSLENRDLVLAQTSSDRNQARADGEALADQIGRVAGHVHNSYILSALQTPWQSWTEQQAVALTNAVRSTRRAVGSPGVSDTEA